MIDIPYKFNMPSHKLTMLQEIQTSSPKQNVRKYKITFIFKLYRKKNLLLSHTQTAAENVLTLPIPVPKRPRSDKGSV